MILAIKKFFISLFALIQSLLISLGIITPARLSSPVTTFMKERENISVKYKDESNMIKSAEYAAGLRNTVSASFDDSSRTAYTFHNAEITMNHTLDGVERYASLKTNSGKTYIENSFKSFYLNKQNNKKYFENYNTEPGRVNTIRLGIYYYDIHVRDYFIKNFGVDKGYHVFGDKLYMEYTLRSKTATKDFNGFGSEIEIPVAKVSKINIADKNGIHTSVDNIDAESVEYAAFDIDGTGVIGFITESEECGKSLDVTEKNGKYIITQLADYNPADGLNTSDEKGDYKYNKIVLGCRIYTDETHDFEGVAKAAFEEKNPLEFSVTDTNANGKVLGYNPLLGTYDITSDVFNFQYAYDNPDLQPWSNVEIKGDSDDRSIVFRCHYTNHGCVESSVILDSNGILAPIDAEVCKNFSGDYGESFYGTPDYAYSDAFYPLSVEKDKNLDFKVFMLSQNWGKYPLKQLSSIEFHVSYYHLSTGATESNCIAPYFVFDRDGWTLPDFRCRSGKIWETQPQFNSVGILCFVKYSDKACKEPVLAEFTGSDIASSGNMYADITNHYSGDNGKYNYSLRHVEMPQTDENRTYYNLKIDFTDDMTVENFKKDFDLFYFDGRYSVFGKASYLDENNKSVTKNVTDNVEYHTLGSDCPYMGFYDITENRIDNDCFGANFALLIKNSKMIIGGKEENIPFVFRETLNKEKLNTASLTLDKEKVEFKKGDSIEINLILLPWGTGKEATDEQVINVREDSCLNPISITANKGTVVDDTYVARVKAENNEAEFTVTGSRNINAVRIDGFDSMKAPKVQEKVNDEWIDYKLSSDNGYDGYSIQLVSDGTYSISFDYFMDSPETVRTFRISN